MFQTMISFNSIRSFQLPTGEFITDPVAMGNLAVNHFKTILGPTQLIAPSNLSPPEWFHELTGYRCPSTVLPLLVSIPTADEITKMMFRLNPNKALGPDGLASGFFKAPWSFLGPEMVQSITHFFHTSFLPTSTNSTILALVPKRPSASAISQFRPISCLNTIYKVISRLLVKMLKPLLPSFIVPNQTAFVKDRLLVENTVLAVELVHGYHKRQGPKRITIKVDIAKAFDSLSWELLFNCLAVPNHVHRLCLSFLLHTTLQIRVYYGHLFSTSTQTCHTSSRHASLDLPASSPSPLSPFSSLSPSVENQSNRRRRHLSLHFPLIFFDAGDRQRSRGYHGVILKWKVISCTSNTSSSHFNYLQSILSRHKLLILLKRLRACICTTSFMVGYNGTVQGYFKGKRGLRQGDPLSPYLFIIAMNVLSIMFNKAAADWKIKYHAKCASSKLTHLCFADDLLIFIDESLSSVQNVLQILREFELRSGLAVSVQKSSSFASGLSQHELDEIKVSTGMPHATLPASYLGFPYCSSFILPKECIKRINILCGSLWVAWFRNEVLDGSLSNYWTVKTSPKFSWLANKLIKLREVVFTSIKMRVGNGRSCRFWIDNWSPFGSLERYLLRGSSERSDEFLQVYIYLTTLELNDEEDIYEWCLTDVPTTRYSTGDVYWKLKPEEEEVPWAKVVWIRGGIPKQSFLTWLFMLNRCPTRDRLLHWGIQTDSSCLLSNNAPESRDHILFQCAYAWDLLCQTLNRCRVTPLWS
ncbi:hypothetical protein Bca4012_063497 [Brassica carinata]